MIKKFDQYIKEAREELTPFMRYWIIRDNLYEYLEEELEKMIKGDEGLTITDASKDDKIPGIGTREDYVDENGEFTHIIVCIRLFYGNSRFIGSFNSMTDFGKHLIDFENKVKELVDVKKVGNYGDYFCYLVEIDDKIKNLVASKEKIKKFNI